MECCYNPPASLFVPPGDAMYALARSILFRLDAETAHGHALTTLDLAHRLKLARRLGGKRIDDPVELMGVRFPNRVGLAAGLDKNAEHLDALGALGFGFVEVGTVTPKPQAGNPRPRLFRLPEAGAIINRMGFNNAGVDHLVERVKASRYDGVIGINIGKNLTTPVERAVDDYLACLGRVHRSEERRVGKERRSRGSTGRQKEDDKEQSA